jgi:hypothetical protein
MGLKHAETTRSTSYLYYCTLLIDSIVFYYQHLPTSLQNGDSAAKLAVLLWSYSENIDLSPIFANNAATW